MVHEISLAEEFAEQRLRITGPITPGSRSKSAARGKHLPDIAARGLVVKHVNTAGVLIVVAAVLAAAADAVLVAQHFQKLGAHLVTSNVRPGLLKKQPGGRKNTGDKKAINNSAAVQQKR